MNSEKFNSNPTIQITLNGKNYEMTLNELKDLLTNSIQTKDKYKEAYNLLLEYWDSLDKEQKTEANKELNKIFGKGHSEYVEW